MAPDQSATPFPSTSPKLIVCATRSGEETGIGCGGAWTIFLDVVYPPELHFETASWAVHAHACRTFARFVGNSHQSRRGGGAQRQTDGFSHCRAFGAELASACATRRRRPARANEPAGRRVEPMGDKRVRAMKGSRRERPTSDGDLVTERRRDGELGIRRVGNTNRMRTRSVRTRWFSALRFRGRDALQPPSRLFQSDTGVHCSSTFPNHASERRETELSAVGDMR